MQEPVGRTIGLANKQRVLNELRKKRHASADNLVRSTGLSMPTVQKWLAELEVEGLVRQSERGESTGGRPPVLFEFEATREYIVGLAVEIPYVSASVTDLDGRIHATTSKTMPTDREPAETLSFLYDLVNELTSSALPSGKSVSAMGIAFSGFLDFTAGLSLATPRMPQWKSIPVRSLFRDRYSIPVSLTTHIDTLAMAERTAGLSSNLDDFLFFDVGWGVGTRVVHGGEIIVSPFGNSGLIGHTTVVPDGRLCLCGNRGCLEEYASGRALVRIAANILAPDQIDVNNVPELARRLLGEDADHWLEHPSIHEFLSFLAIGIANSINIFGIPKVVLGGYLIEASLEVQALLEKEVRGRLQPTLQEHLELLFSNIPRSIGSAYGAALMALKNSFPGFTPVAVWPERTASLSGRGDA